MLPVVGVPETVRKGLRPYRDLFRRDEGFEYVSRYVTGLLVSPKKTWQGIYAQQVWLERDGMQKNYCPGIGNWLPRSIAIVGGK